MVNVIQYRTSETIVSKQRQPEDNMPHALIVIASNQGQDLMSVESLYTY